MSSLAHSSIVHYSFHLRRISFPKSRSFRFKLRVHHSQIITSCILKTVGKGLIGLVTPREEILELVKLDDAIDLVTPRGGNELVYQIKFLTKIPILGHADGICHVYVDKSADMEKAMNICLDAKTDYLAACNVVSQIQVKVQMKFKVRISIQDPDNDTETLHSGGLEKIV